MRTLIVESDGIFRGSSEIDSSSDAHEQRQLMEGHPPPGYLQVVLRDMVPREDAEYYAISLSASGDGRVRVDTFSRWVGWADEERRREVRAARLAHPNLFRTAGWPFVAVHDLQQLSIFFVVGGHGLIERGLAETELQDLIEPHPVVPDGWIGFKAVDLTDSGALTYAPSPKLRMKVLKRDRYRCRICGRGPEHSTDIQLRVHHIRPFGLGGLTEERNLLTLCHTCHDGLDPHWDYALSPLAQPLDLAALDEEFREGVSTYRRLMRKTLQGEEDDLEKPKSS